MQRQSLKRVSFGVRGRFIKTTTTTTTTTAKMTKMTTTETVNVSTAKPLG